MSVLDCFVTLSLRIAATEKKVQNSTARYFSSKQVSDQFHFIACLGTWKLKLQLEIEIEEVPIYKFNSYLVQAISWRVSK